MPDSHPSTVTRVLSELARGLGTALDAGAALDLALDALRQLAPVHGGALWLDGTGGLRCAAAEPADLDLEPGSGALEAPLVSLGEVLGTLVVETEPGHTPDDVEHVLVEAVAVLVAGALERAQLFREVMELERLKSDFIARVSHELRTPITIIHGFIDTLLAHEDRLDADQRRHMLQRSQAAADRLARLIEELLIVSRLEAGVLTPEPATVALDELLESVRSAATDPDLVHVDAAAGATSRTDHELLSRAVAAVIDNAVKYGGTAEVAVRAAGPGWIIAVRDHGPGFSDDVRSTAFEMFTRGSVTNAVPGIGVGLAIARTLLEVLNASIEVVDVTDGPGALVEITLPR
jgi:K+-sensing histidine kinase KdpD